MALLIRENLLHVQRRNGTKDCFGVHELLCGQHLTQVRCVDPRGLLKLIIRVFVFRVSHNLREFDIIAVGVLKRRLDRLGMRCARGVEARNLALSVLRGVAGCDGVLFELRGAFGWSLNGLGVIIKCALRRLGCVDRRDTNRVCILDGPQCCRGPSRCEIRTRLSLGFRLLEACGSLRLRSRSFWWRRLHCVWSRLRRWHHLVRHRCTGS